MTEEVKAPETGETALASAAPTNQTPTMWTDDTLMTKAYRAAKYLAASDLVPEQTYRDKPQNCLIALDISNRLGMSPLIVMQQLYIVKGKPSWSGQFCVAAINGCGKFTPLEYVWTEENGGGCAARATRIATGQVCQSSYVTMKMATDEGWLQKNGSKWKSMPQQMMMYRAAAFFARTFCPELLLGLQTVEEVRDTYGVDDIEKPVVTISMNTEVDA